LRSAFVAISLAVACGGSAREPAPSPAPKRVAPAPPATSAAAKAPDPGVTELAKVGAPEQARVAFPPASFSPPEARSAQPGDGQWVRLGDANAGDRAGEGEPLLFRSVVHPHPVSKWVSVTLVAIDLQRTELFLVAGTEEPKSKDAPPALRSGLVAEDHRDALLAVFNGGWKTAHGNWGVMVGGHVFVAPKPDGCTIAPMKDGTVRIAAWPKLETKTAEMRAFRQTPPCLLEGGQLPGMLQAGQERAWGGMDPKLKTRQRSAVGVDASGKILYYAYSEEAGAKKLAEGLKAAGVVDAAELDINYIWTRFLLFGKTKKDGKLGITSSLAPKMSRDKGGYVDRAHARDFFYVKKR
jgi:hypothetical protein